MKLMDVFVNRDHEISRLEEFYSKTAGGSGTVVMLSGRIGTGKTALIDRFLETKRGFYFECVVGQPPYAPLKNFLTAFFSIERKEVPPSMQFLVDEKEEKVEGETLEEAFTALLRFFNSYITAEPVVFAIDNFQDVDEGTIKFLDYFVRHPELAKIMIICAYRTEMLEETGRGKTISDFLQFLIMNNMFNAVIVDNFNESTTGLLLAKMFGENVPLDGVKQIYQKSSGNPLMLMEMLKIIVQERNIDLAVPENWNKIEWDKLSIPANLQEIFQMELDSLPPEGLALLDYMAVAGNEFEEDIVSEASREPLDLVQKIANLMVEKGILTQDSKTGKYRFTRNVYMEIIYNDIGSKILPICFAVGSAIEKLRKDRLGEYVFDLVRLFGNSRDRKRAYEYAIMAGGRAEKLHAPESVEKYYELAIAIADELNLDWADIYEIKMKKGMGLFYLGAWEKAENCFVEMMKIAKEHEDKKRETESLLLLIRLRQYQSEYEKARALLQKAIELAKGTADSKFIADALRGVAHMEWKTGEYDNAIKHYNEALSYFQSASAEAIFTGNLQVTEENIPIKGEILLELGNVYAEMGDYRQALLFNLKGLKILKETNSPAMARALHNIGAIHLREENWQKAMESFKQGIEYAEKLNDLDTMGWCYLGLAETLFRSGGSKEEANQHIEKANQHLSKISDRIGNALLHKIYANLCLQMNDIAGAENHIKVAEEIGQKIASPYISGELLTARIELAIKKGERENAVNLLKTLEELSMKHRMKSFGKFIEAKKKELQPQPPPSPQAPPVVPGGVEGREAKPAAPQEGAGRAEGREVPPDSQLTRKKRKKKKGGDMQ
ncbi:MAG: tetratricopeptide repeat protein [Thermoplasmata archaeon]|nr:tetratricopeptide repeat protein [Thermoplasmata archaeon]